MPAPLRHALTGHDVSTARERGWSTLENGRLLASAEREGFPVFVTADSNLMYQQRLATLRIAVIVLTTTSWPRIERAVGAVIEAVDRATEGSYTEVMIP